MSGYIINVKAPVGTCCSSNNLKQLHYLDLKGLASVRVDNLIDVGDEVKGSGDLPGSP